MKKTLKILGILLLLATINLQAKVLFDLHDQYFKNTLLDRKNHFTPKGRYDLPNVTVSTNTYYEDGAYNPLEDTPGYFSVNLKNPPKEWSVVVSVYHYFLPTIIRVTSVTGKSNTVTLSGVSSDRDKLQINNEDYKVRLSGRISQITFEYKNNILTIFLNGKAALKEKQPNEKLKKIEVLLQGDSVSSSRRAKLTSLQVFGE